MFILSVLTLTKYQLASQSLPCDDVFFGKKLTCCALGIFVLQDTQFVSTFMEGTYDNSTNNVMTTPKKGRCTILVPARAVRGLHTGR